jgi:hypothetical protein
MPRWHFSNDRRGSTTPTIGGGAPIGSRGERARRSVHRNSSRKLRVHRTTVEALERKSAAD